MTNKLSALIIVHNEGKQLNECLKTISFADEIIVILDKCSDSSEEIAKKFTKNIFRGSWQLEGDRRNYGIKKCSNSWVFEIDADERVPVLLQNEIRKCIDRNIYDYFLIPVNNYIGKNIVKYGWGAYFGKSSYPGLFKKDNKVWGKQRVHPKLILIGRKGFTLQNAIKHYYCKNISDMLIKLDKYSSARALDLLEQKNTENSMKNFRRLFSRFWKCFILRKGYKEKNIGLMIAIMASLYPLLSYAKYLFLKKND